MLAPHGPFQSRVMCAGLQEPLLIVPVRLWTVTASGTQRLCPLGQHQAGDQQPQTRFNFDNA